MFGTIWTIQWNNTRNTLRLLWYIISYKLYGLTITTAAIYLNSFSIKLFEETVSLYRKNDKKNMYTIFRRNYLFNLVLRGPV